jgi:hypothetical protein
MRAYGHFSPLPLFRQMPGLGRHASLNLRRGERGECVGFSLTNQDCERLLNLQKAIDILGGIGNGDSLPASKLKLKISKATSRLNPKWRKDSVPLDWTKNDGIPCIGTARLNQPHSHGHPDGKSATGNRTLRARATTDPGII